MHPRNYLYIALLLIGSGCNPNQQATNKDNVTAEAVPATIAIYDSAALAMIDPSAHFELLASGFYWSEGPLWVDELQSVIFSDVPTNKIYKWNEQDSLSLYLEFAGHSGAANKSSDKGSNGLILDHENRLLLCQHGDRRIAVLDADLNNATPQFITIADSYNQKRFNSPNDLAIDNAGTIYFTDPPYGQTDNKTAEIGINGVFKVTANNEVSLLIDSLSWPNGIALSPDQQTLYINQSDPENPVLYRYDIAGDGTLTNGSILFDFSAFAKSADGLPDGLKVHRNGTIFATGPGGIHLISAQGKHLATLKTAKATANCAFDSNQTYLYITSSDQLMRIKLN